MDKREVQRILDGALERRNQFLKDHPEYQSQQDEIERILKATPDEFKLDVMGVMLWHKFSELQSVFEELKKKKMRH